MSCSSGPKFSFKSLCATRERGSSLPTPALFIQCQAVLQVCYYCYYLVVLQVHCILTITPIIHYTFKRCHAFVNKYFSRPKNIWLLQHSHLCKIVWTSFHKSLSKFTQIRGQSALLRPGVCEAGQQSYLQLQKYLRNCCFVCQRPCMLT